MAAAVVTGPVFTVNREFRLKSFEFPGVTTHDPLPMFYYLYKVADDFSGVEVLWSAGFENERQSLAEPSSCDRGFSQYVPVSACAVRWD